jgi:hypothetical protein
MTKSHKESVLYFYIVKLSKDADWVDNSGVPYKVNSKLIFFGPCKKRLREDLYNSYIKTSKSGRIKPKQNIYIIGLNGSNSKKKRKIIWIGKIREIFFFFFIYHEMKRNGIFSPLLKSQHSPLHLYPHYSDKNGKILNGYISRNTYHAEDNEWIMDIISNRNHPEILVQDNKILLKSPSKRFEILNRDCCFLCKNIFYAEGKGIEIDDYILEKFQMWQPSKDDIDNYAIFGRRSDNSANGLTGYYLKVKNNGVNDFIKYLKSKSDMKVPEEIRYNKNENMSHCKKC